MHLVLAAVATLLAIQYVVAPDPEKVEARFSMIVQGKLKYHEGAGVSKACLGISKLELLDKDSWHDEQACGHDENIDAEINEETMKSDDAKHAAFKLNKEDGGFHLAGVAWDPFDDEALLEPMIRIVLKADHGCVHTKLAASVMVDKDKHLWTNKNVLRIAAPRKYSQLFTEWDAPNKSFKESPTQKFADEDKVSKIAANWGAYGNPVAKWMKPNQARKHATFNFGEINVSNIEFMNCPGAGCFFRKTQKCGFTKPSEKWEADVEDNNGKIAWPKAQATPDKDIPKADRFPPHEA